MDSSFTTAAITSGELLLGALPSVFDGEDEFAGTKVLVSFTPFCAFAVPD